MMKALLTDGTGIHMQKLKLLIPHHFKDMGVPTDEKIGRVLPDVVPNALIVAARIATYVGDPYVYPFQGEALVLGPVGPHLVVIYIAINSPYGCPLFQAVGKGERAYIAGVPYFIWFAQKSLRGAIQEPVGIAEKGNLFQALVWVPLPAK